MITTRGVLKNTNQGLMIGNSSLGAIIFGEKLLSISLDKIDLWDDRMPKEFKDPKFTYANMENLLNNDYKKAYELFDKCYMSPYPSKINSGLIQTNIETSNDDIGYIDYQSAQVTYISKNNTLQAYVDAYEDVIVIKSTNSFNFDIKLPSYFYKKVRDNGLNYPQPKLIKENGFLIINQKMYAKKQFNIIAYKNNNTLLVTISTKKDILKSKELILKYAANLDYYYQKHLKKVNKFNQTSKIKIPDKQISDLYNLGKYFFFANSSKKIPVTTQGVWTQYSEESLPPWKSDLHNDLNVQLSYEPFFKTGNIKEGKTLLNFLEKNKNKFAKNAEKFLETDALFIPGVMTQKCELLGGWPQYSLSLCCQIWLLNIFDLYFEYTKDIKYLEKTIYPFFKGIEKGIRKYLIEDSEGKIMLGFHSSPEYFEDSPKSIFKDQSNFELTCLTYLYQRLKSYSLILKVDNTFYVQQLEKLNPLYRNKNNELMMTKSIEFDMSHRHFSHMLCYSNVPILDLNQNKNILKKDLNKLINYSTDKWVGFSYTEYADMLALSDNGEEAYKTLKIVANNFVHENGFHMNNDFKEYKYSKMDCYVFTLEANFSFVKAVNNMLLQNYGNRIKLFPAIPDEFKNKGVSFKNLRLVGGHKINAKIKNQNINFSIKLKTPDILLIQNNLKNNPTIIIDGCEKSFVSNIGDTIEIKACKSIIFQ